MTVSLDSTAYKTLRDEALKLYLQQHHYFDTMLFKAVWFPLDSEGTANSVVQQIINALIQQGELDWTTVGTLGNLQVANPTREAILAQVKNNLYPGVVTVSCLLMDGIKDIAGFFLGLLQTNLNAGAYGTTKDVQFAYLQLLQNQANALAAGG